MNDNAGWQDFKMPFPVTQVQQGRYITLKSSVSSSSDWRIINQSLYFTPEAVQSE